MKDSVNTLLEYLKNHPYQGFKPLPWVNKEGRQIEWFWKDEPGYSESIIFEGKWIGSIHKSEETDEIIGIDIHLEAVTGLEEKKE